MDEHIIKHKIEITIDLICRLYREELITHAFIVGSVAKGTARKESDIDIYIINPLFQEEVEVGPIFELQSMSLPSPPYPGKMENDVEKLLESWKINIDLAHKLKDIGAEFKQIERKEKVFWYQLYRGELFHIMTRKILNPFIEGIEITRDMCTT